MAFPRNLCCVIWLTTSVSVSFLSAQSSPRTAQTNGPVSLQQQLQQVQLQRAANQKLLWDATSDTAESFAKASVATSEAAGVDSGETLTRLAEISNEIKLAARNNDATKAANLAVEAGRILGWQIATAVNDTAEHLASVAALVGSYPANLISSAQAYIRFAKFFVEDQRLAQRAKQLSTPACTSQGGKCYDSCLPLLSTGSNMDVLNCVDRCNKNKCSVTPDKQP
jgi:hypothetical protein